MSKGKVIQPDFGGEGPRQVIGSMLKQADTYRAVFAVVIKENGETEVWSNTMRKTDLAVISARVQGIALCAINGWEVE